MVGTPEMIPGTAYAPEKHQEEPTTTLRFTAEFQHCGTLLSAGSLGCDRCWHDSLFPYNLTPSLSKALLRNFSCPCNAEQRVTSRGNPQGKAGA